MKQTQRIRESSLFMLIMCFILLFVAGCSKTQSSQKTTADSETTKEKVLVVAISTDPDIPAMDAATYKGAIALYQLLYDGLVDYGDKGEILPGLAKSWDISANGKEYTFHLREDVKFSDGTDCDAEAVLFNLKRWVNNPSHKSLVASGVEKMEALDKGTIKITFNKNAYQILSELSYPRPVRMLSSNSVEKVADDQVGKFIKPVGTGPWMVKSYVKDQETVFVPNPYYWGEKPKLDKLVFKVIPDGQTRVMALQRGEVDIVGGERLGKLPLENLDMLDKEKGITMKVSASTPTHYINFNNDNKIFDDINVRLAFNYAINKESMVKNLLNGVGKPAIGIFQFTVPYVTQENNKGYEYNKEKAKELLAQSGWKDTNNDGIVEKDGKPFEIKLVYQTADYPEWKPMSEFVQAELAAIGVKLHLFPLEKNAYNEARATTRDYDLTIHYTPSDSWLPHGALTNLFCRTGKNNRAPSWEDVALEKMIYEMMETMDKTQRQQKYDKIAAYMYENAVCVPLYYPEVAFAINSKVAGFEIGPTSYLPIQWEKLDVK